MISSADRVAAGNEAIRQFHTDCFVLDDGFQHLRLARDLNIVTIDATNPWGRTFAALRSPARTGEWSQSSRHRRHHAKRSGTQRRCLRAEIRDLTNARIFESRMRNARRSLNNSSESVTPPVAAFAPSAIRVHSSNNLHTKSFSKKHSRIHRYSQTDIDLLTKTRQQRRKEPRHHGKRRVKLRSLSVFVTLLRVGNRTANRE